MAENEKQGGEEVKAAKGQQGLIDEACKAFGIDKQYVLGSGIGEDGRAVICTQGGAKVRYARGDKPEALTALQVTGVNPNPKKRKPIAGKERTA